MWGINFVENDHDHDYDDDDDNDYTRTTLMAFVWGRWGRK